MAATCAAYYIAEPAVYRPPAITGDSLGTHAKARSHNSSPKKAVDRPVRLADSDAWIDSLRSNAYWKQRSSGTSGSSGSGETSRSDSQRRFQSERAPRNGEGRSGYKFSSTRYSLSGVRQEGSTYRTVCVRLCDGFFWPISFGTTKSNLKRDSETCQKSCESPVGLHYYANPDGGPEDLVSLDGQSYTQLRGAFLYQTTYQPSCKCRPHPWEQEAIERHVGYAKKAESGSSQPPSEQ
ncbi:MAG: DUF2865 domain-containing protein [Hyphomicrobiaceae bacterium]